MILGFTGSRHPLPAAQRARLALGLGRLLEAGATDLHHGDCVGADATAHEPAVALGLRAVVHPPTQDSLRAWCQGDETREPLPYLQRNRAIVDACDVLIACPGGPEVQRSGTWSTVRYARKVGQRVVIVMPDGSISK